MYGTGTIEKKENTRAAEYEKCKLEAQGGRKKSVAEKQSEERWTNKNVSVSGD